MTFPRERVNIKYDNIHLSTPAEILQDKQQAIAKRKEEASRNNSVFFDGPNTRMLGFRVSPEDEYSAFEIEHLMLHLGPVGWYDYVGLNEGFRAQFETSDAPLKVYEYYVGLGDLVTHGDVSKSRLSNIVESAATIITADGHLIYGQRTGRVMGPNKFTCAVAENINRYLDDTDPSHPMFPLNLPRKNINSLPDAPFDSRYIPAGVPDPFAAVRRGLSSEISPGVYEAIPTTAIRITGIAFDLDIVHPTILFVIFAPISMDELFTLHEQKPGRETYEVTLHSMKADSRDPAAVSVLRDRDWVQSGKASVLRALEVIEASRRIHRCSLPDAIETIVRS